MLCAKHAKIPLNAAPVLMDIHWSKPLKPVYQWLVFISILPLSFEHALSLCPDAQIAVLMEPLALPAKMGTIYWPAPVTLVQSNTPTVRNATIPPVLTVFFPKSS